MISRIEALVLNILGEKEELFNPQSRVEEILYSILQDTAYIKNPLSRIEAILLAIKNSDEHTRNALSRVEEILLAFKNGTNDYDKIPQSDIERDLIRFLGEWVTKSGSIVSYDTDQVTPPLKKLEVKMEPVQDLHGYDNPWPGGGGKNLFDASTVPTTTLNGVTCVNNGDGSFTINGTATGTSDTFFNLFRSQFNADFGGTPLPSAEYRLTGVPSGAGSSAFYVYTTPSYIADMGDGRTFTNTITGGAIYIKSGTTVNNVTIWPMIRLASNGDDTYAPYSNICPISGRTGAKVTRTGRNILPPTFSNGYYDTTNGEFVSSSNWRASEKMKCNPSTTYTLSGSSYGAGGTNGRSVFWDENNRYLSSGGTGSTIATPASACWMAFYIGKDYLTETMQLELGSTATAYEPYQGDTYNVEFPISTGTVYGGTLDVVTGELVVDRAIVDLGTLNWKYASSGTRSLFTSYDLGNKYKPSGAYNIPVKAAFECYANVAMGTTFKNGEAGLDGNTSNRIVICDNRYTDAVTFKSAVSGVQLCYELATPITTQLTPTEIRSLLGRNNIWSDAGDVTVCYHS